MWGDIVIGVDVAFAGRPSASIDGGDGCLAHTHHRSRNISLVLILVLKIWDRTLVHLQPQRGVETEMAGLEMQAELVEGVTSDW